MARGGKSRSIPVPDTAAGGRLDLPGAHGLRLFPGVYHNVPDSMRRTPFPGNDNGVWDNLVAAEDGIFARNDGRADSTAFGFIPHRSEFTPEGMRRIIVEELVNGRGIPPHEAEFFANRLVVFLTSSDERRFGQWEHTSWWDYVRAEQFSDEYRTVVARGMTSTLVAAKEDVASTRTIGNMAEAFLMNIMGRGNDGDLDRVLNAPTNEAWIDPWVDLLRAQGVRFHVGQTAAGFAVSGGRISAARLVDADGRATEAEADWYVCATPVERARALWTPEVLRLDPGLELMDELFTDWMNGIMYYLAEPVDITHGHIAFMDSPWALTALTQAQFWEGKDFAGEYGDGSAVDCLSVDISDWDTPGMLFGKPAKRCSPEEIAAEAWAQIKDHLEDTGKWSLPDEIVRSWFLDPAIGWDPATGRNSNDEPLLINTVGSWDKRPSERTEIANLFLAGDYVRTDVDLATMESANESARRAVNALLDAADSGAERVEVFELYDPPEFEPFKAADAEAFRAGLPNAFDRPDIYGNLPS
jgi:uncharacterized protein with NAD-binding domain and iron-sulfur cluster